MLGTYENGHWLGLCQSGYHSWEMVRPGKEHNGMCTIVSGYAGKTESFKSNFNYLVLDSSIHAGHHEILNNIQKVVVTTTNFFKSLF